MADAVASEKTILGIEAGGAVVEGLAALAAVVLAILGIIGLMPLYMASIASILIGAALLAQGSAIASEYSKLLSRLSGGTFGTIELGTGTTTEFVIGGAAVTLGILSLVNIHPHILLPAAVIAIGAALVLTSGATTRLNELKLEAAKAGEVAHNMARSAVSSAAGAQMLAGLATIVLGIIALVMAIDVMTMTMTLVGLLVGSAALTLSASALSGKMLGALHQERSSADRASQR
jgi:hypothetical protein